MLPSFRLIAATFFCGFIVVFAGLRFAASLNVIHESLPVMAAHAAPMPAAPAADRDARRGVSSVPVMYDLRFAVNPVSPTLVRATPMAIERAIPLLPLTILPPDLIPPEEAAPVAAAEPAPAVAALQPDVQPETPPPLLAVPSQAVVIEPVLPPATESPAATETQPKETVAAIDPVAPPTVPEPAAAEPDSTASIDVPLPTAPADESVGVPLPLVKPQQASAAPKAVAKPKPRKLRARTAQRPASNNAFDINNPATSPFGSMQQ